MKGYLFAPSMACRGLALSFFLLTCFLSKAQDPDIFIISPSGDITVCPDAFVEFEAENTVNCSDISFQWEGSPDGATWSSIGSATGLGLGINVNEDRYFRICRTCPGPPSVYECSGAVLITVSALTDPEPITEVTQDPPSPICENIEVTLTAQGGDGGTIYWYDSDDLDNLIGSDTLHINPGPSETTTYYAVSESEDCDLTSNIASHVVEVVSLPVVTLVNEPDTICVGSSFTFIPNEMNYDEYAWTFLNGMPNSGSDSGPHTIVYNQIGNFNITINTSQGECTSFSYFTIEVIPLPNISVFEEPDIICVNGNHTYQVSAFGNIEYEWIFHGGDPNEAEGPGPFTVTYPDIGNYDVEITGTHNSIGCTNTETLSIEVSPLPTINLLNEPNEICVDGTFEYAVEENPGVSYMWDFTGGDPEVDTTAQPPPVTYSEAGEFTVTITATNDMSQCSTTQQLGIEVSEELAFEINNLSSNTGPISFEAVSGFPFEAAFSSDSTNVEYTWTCEAADGDINGLPASGTGSFTETWSLPDTEGLDEGLVNCEVAAMNDLCETVLEFQVRLEEILFVPDILTPNGDGTNDTWAIACASAQGIDPGIFTIELFDRNGKCAKGCDEPFTINEAKEWDGLDCPAGAYFYIIEGEEGFQEKGSLTILKN